MKKVFFYFAVAATCLLAACARKEAPVTDASDTVKVYYINARGGESTKSEIDNTSAAFTWSAGDQIAVYTGGGYKKSIELAAGGSASASFAFSEDIDADRADFALFPASLVFNGDVERGCASEHEATELGICLPDSYSLSQVQGNVSPVFMIAANAPGMPLEFKHLGALLRIKVQYIPKDAYTLKVTFPGQKVQGEFSLFDYVAGNGVLAEDDDYTDTITITDLGITEFTDNLIINIPVPCGVNSAYVRVGAYDSTDHKINSIDAPIKVVSDIPTAWMPARKATRKVIASLPYFTSNRKTHKKIVFAPGNLQGTITVAANATDKVGSADSWRFAEHQYDALGDCSGNRLENVGDPIDLFAWVGESATKAYTTNQRYGVLWPVRSSGQNGGSHPEKIKYSWAELFNGVTYPANTWRLFNGDMEGGETKRETEVLTTGRGVPYMSTKATLKNGSTIVARGLIFFPDNYVHPYGVKNLVNYGVEADIKGGHYADNEISLAEWDLLENVGGCAFLPVTCVRSIVSDDVNTSKYYGEAAYWNDFSNSTSQAAGLMVSDLDVCTDTFADSKTNIAPRKSINRGFGLAVRLIRDVN